MLPNDNVSMSVGHPDHVLIVYSSMEHVTWKSPGPTPWVGRILHPDSTHARRCLPDPKCLFYLSGLSLCFSVECRPLLPYPSRWHGSLPRHSLWWLTCELHCSPLPWRLAARVCVPAVKESCTSFLCSLILRPNFLPVSQTYELEQFLKLSHTWHQVISRSRAPSSYKQSRRHQDVRRHRNVVIR